MSNPNAIWHQRTKEKHAEICLMNDQYRYQVFQVWHGQFEMEDGPLLAEGWQPTLAKAKQEALKQC